MVNSHDPMLNRAPAHLQRIIFVTIATSAFVACIVTNTFAGEMTDVVNLDHGGYVMGEIRKMSLGRLTLDTDEMDVISIKWSHIVGLKTTNRFQVEINDGTEYFGNLDTTRDPGWLVVSSGSMRDTLDIQRVVSIIPISRGFWVRLDGYLNLGFTFTKSSEVLQLTMSSLTIYRTREYAVRLTADVIFNRADGVTTTQRQDYFLGYKRSLVKDWFAGVAVAPQQNKVMGVNLRTLLAASVGNDLIQTNHDVLALSGGIDWIKEESTGSEPVRQGWEVLGNLSYNFFRHDFPVTSVIVNLGVFRSLMISGRTRLEFDTTVGREFIKDLHTSLRLYGSYDNDPPAQGAAEQDYGIVLSLGWTY